MDEQRMISRRGVFAGLGAVGVAGAAGMLAPGTAYADAPSRGPRLSPAGARPHAVPAGVNPLASAPQKGCHYAFTTMWDFSPEHYSSGRAWSPTGGVYAPSGVGDNLWATVDLPPGAILADVEWYLSATEAVAMMGRLWVAGDAYLSVIVADGTLAAGTSQARATRIVVPQNTNGPFPHGTKLVLGLFTPATGTISINGARVGYKLAPTGQVLLPAPVRVYDSHHHKKIAAHGTRIHSLAAHLPIGATGALLNVTATGAERGGSLVVYSAAVPKPSTSSLHFAKQTPIANSVQSSVSATRAIKISSSAKTHYIIDLVGYLA